MTASSEALWERYKKLRDEETVNVRDEPWSYEYSVGASRALSRLVSEQVARAVEEERAAIRAEVYQIRKGPEQVGTYYHGWNSACDAIDNAIRSRIAAGGEEEHNG